MGVVFLAGEKLWPLLGGFLGGIFSGGPAWWVAYSNYDSAQAAKPYAERESIVSSFSGQIASAEKRGDAGAVVKLRADYEKYEQRWRDARLLAALVEPIEKLSSPQLSAAKTAEVNRLLSSMASSAQAPNVDAKTIGAGYFATQQYGKAAEYLSAASSQSREFNAETRTLTAASYQALALTTPNEAQRAKYMAAAQSNLDLAKKSSRSGDRKIEDFFRQSAELATKSSNE